MYTYICMPVYIYIVFAREQCSKICRVNTRGAARRGAGKFASNVLTNAAHCLEATFRATMSLASVSRMSRCRWNRVTITRRGVLFRNSNRRVSNPSSGRAPGRGGAGGGPAIISRANNPFPFRPVCARVLDFSPGAVRVLFPAPRRFTTMSFISRAGERERTSANHRNSDTRASPDLQKTTLFPSPPWSKHIFFFRIRPTKNRRVF